MDQTNRRNISGAQFVQPADDFQIQSSSATVGFERGYVMPPAAAYVTVDDQLQLSVAGMFNANSVIATVRILRADGVVIPLVFQANTAGNRSLAVKSFQLIEGYLLSVSMGSLGPTGDVNPCYASAQLVRTPFATAQSSMVLCSGYLSQAFPVSWPANKPQTQFEGPGALTTISGVAIGTPVAGADWTYTVAGFMRMRLKSISAVLTTAAAVANRNVNLQIDDGANVYASIPSGFSQVASLVNRYTWMDGAPAPVAFDNKAVIPIPGNLEIPAGHRISVVTTGLQAADQWSTIIQLAHIWLNQQ